MRKTLRRVLATACAVMMAGSLLTGCGGAASEAESATAETGTTVSTSSPEDEYYMVSFLSGIDYWKTCFRGMEDAASLLGVTAKYTGQTDSDVAGEVAVLEQVIAMKPKGIAITCVNSTAFQDTIDSAIEQGISVVTFDSDSPTSQRSSYLSTGNEDAGKAAAEYLVPLCGNKGKIAVLYTVGQENTESRLEGFRAWCEENAPDVELVLVNDAGDTTTATDNLAAALQANPDIVGVFCADGTAGGAGPVAVEESGIEGIHTLAFDVDKTVLDKVKDGSIDGTVAQGQYNMGYWSMMMLYAEANGISTADLPGYVDTGVTIVTKENVDEYYVQDSTGGQFTPDQFKGAESDEYYMVSFLSGIDYWKTCFNGMQAAGDFLGVTTKYTGQTDSDVAGEVAVLEQVIAMKPKGIAITCVNSTAFQDTIDSAIEQGISVVTFDSDSPTSQRSSYLSTGNEDAGKAAAEYLVPLCGNKGKIAVLYTVGQENTESRLEGFRAWCEENAPDVELVLVNDAGDTTTATDNLAAALQANPDIVGVFCADGTAGGAGPVAVEESGIEGIHTLAFDVDKTVLDKVKDGSIDGTVAQGQFNMGFWSMMMLYAEANGLTEADLPGYVDTGVTIVTKDTVDNYYVS